MSLPVPQEAPQTPTDLADDPEAALAAMQRRVARIADEAFWAAQAEALAGDPRGAAAERLADLLADLGSGLLTVLPNQVGPPCLTAGFGTGTVTGGDASVHGNTRKV